MRALDRRWLLAAAVLSLPLAAPASAQEPELGFFLASVGVGDGANLGGLEGADAHCLALAEEVGAGHRTWRAYLSTQAVDGAEAVNARDRIGAGPWHNAEGVLIAATVEELHSEAANINKDTALTEAGAVVPGRGDTPNQHDILTGSQLDGTAFEAGQDRTCGNWTLNGEGSAFVGHHDLIGNPSGINYWNHSHGSRGCSQENLQQTGGAGLFYCFAAD